MDSNIKYNWTQIGLTDGASSSQVKVLYDLYDKAAEFLLNEQTHAIAKPINDVEVMIFPVIYRLVVKNCVEAVNIPHLILKLREDYQKFLASVKDNSTSHLDMEAEFANGFCKGYAFNLTFSNMKNTI